MEVRKTEVHTPEVHPAKDRPKDVGLGQALSDLHANVSALVAKGITPELSHSIVTDILAINRQVTTALEAAK